MTLIAWIFKPYGDAKGQPIPPHQNSICLRLLLILFIDLLKGSRPTRRQSWEWEWQWLPKSEGHHPHPQPPPSFPCYFDLLGFQMPQRGNRGRDLKQGKVASI